MYPRVRVKESDESVSKQEVATSYILKVVESLSLEGNGSIKSIASDQKNSVKSGDDRNRSNTRASSIPLPRAVLSSPAEKSIKGGEKGKRSNIRASSVLRPRAVLSSPDNDDIIGNQNKRIQKRRPSTNGRASDYNGVTNRQSFSLRTSESKQSQNCRNARLSGAAYSSDKRSVCSDPGVSIGHSKMQSLGSSNRKPQSLPDKSRTISSEEDHSSKYNPKTTFFSLKTGDMKQSQSHRNSCSDKGRNTFSNGYPKIKCPEDMLPKLEPFKHF